MRTLDELAQAFIAARARAVHGGDVAQARAECEALLTRHEPWRGQARADVELALAGWLPIGFGREVHVEPAQPAPFERWSGSIAPCVLVVSWSNDMGGQDHDHARFPLARVALEEDGFCIVAVYDDASRAEARLEAELVARARSASSAGAQRTQVAPPSSSNGSAQNR